LLNVLASASGDDSVLDEMAQMLGLTRKQLDEKLKTVAGTQLPVASYQNRE
jgi:hypothetical protein